MPLPNRGLLFSYTTSQAKPTKCLYLCFSFWGRTLQSRLKTVLKSHKQHEIAQTEVPLSVERDLICLKRGSKTAVWDFCTMSLK